MTIFTLYPCRLHNQLFILTNYEIYFTIIAINFTPDYPITIIELEISLIPLVLDIDFDDVVLYRYGQEDLSRK